MKIQIHKNELARYFLKDIDQAVKIGKEKMRRWIDIPEYLQVEPENTSYPKLEIQDPLIDKMICVCGHTRDSHNLHTEDCSLCICAQFVEPLLKIPTVKQKIRRLNFDFMKRKDRGTDLQDTWEILGKLNEVIDYLNNKLK